MGVTARPESIQYYGATIRDMASGEPALAPATLGADGPLSMSAGLSVANSVSQDAAVNFAKAKDAGLTNAGNVLIQIGQHLADYDQKGAAGIRKALPTAPKSPAN